MAASHGFARRNCFDNSARTKIVSEHIDMRDVNFTIQTKLFNKVVSTLKAGKVS